MGYISYPTPNLDLDTLTAIIIQGAKDSGYRDVRLAEYLTVATLVSDSLVLSFT